MSLTYLIIGIVAGGLWGLIGTGAGLIIIPALIFFAHFNEKTAVGTSLALLALPVGLFAAATYWKHGYVNFRAVGWILVGFVVTSVLAARFAQNLPAATIERIFGIAAILIGLRMLFA